MGEGRSDFMRIIDSMWRTVIGVEPGPRLIHCVGGIKRIHTLTIEKTGPKSFLATESDLGGNVYDV